MKANIKVEEIYALIQLGVSEENGQELSGVIQSFETSDLDKNHLIIDFKPVAVSDLDDVLLDGLAELIDIAQANNGHTVLTGTDDEVKQLLSERFEESDDLEFLPKIEEGVDAIFMADLLNSFDLEEGEV